MDKRKKYYLILDVETANNMDFPFVYDIGFIVGDKQGNIYEKKSYAIAEMFDHYKDLLDSAYYAEKMPDYHRNIWAKKMEKVPFVVAKKEIKRIMTKYDIHEVYAYNASFDRRALNITQRYMTKSQYRWFFPYGTEFRCIWNMACSTIFQQKTFHKLAEKYQWKTATGKNISTNAETAYKYTTGDFGFTEKHMGLDDVLIEYNILLKVLQQHKKVSTGINPSCWRQVK